MSDWLFVPIGLIVGMVLAYLIVTLLKRQALRQQVGYSTDPTTKTTPLEVDNDATA